jgi:indoleamine 2,3-dioxygenase
VEKDVPNPENLIGTWRKYPGASAGQSPLIHSLDVALGIHHLPMGVCPVSGGSSSFNPTSSSTEIREPLPRGNGLQCPSTATPPNPMLEMREALPKEFQDFICDLEKAPSIRDYCNGSGTKTLKDEFNRCCLRLKEFRDSHLALASTYIVTQTKGHIVGTGGTDLVPFLKQVRSETTGAMLD